VGRSESRSRWPGTISDAYACRSNDHVRRVWSTFPSAHVATTRRSRGYVPLKRRYCIKEPILPTSTYVTTVCWVHRKRFCDIKALGVMYSKPSVCMGKYDSASERHLTRCENPISTMLVNSLRSQEAIRGRANTVRLRRDDRLRMGSRPRV
jgi:hypothetical protein